MAWVVVVVVVVVLETLPSPPTQMTLIRSNLTMAGTRFFNDRGA
jgi:hypothetical protein